MALCYLCEAGELSRNPGGGESVEERGPPEGNASWAISFRTESRVRRGVDDASCGRVKTNESRPPYPREEPYEVVLHVRI